MPPTRPAKAGKSAMTPASTFGLSTWPFRCTILPRQREFYGGGHGLRRRAVVGSLDRFQFLRPPDCRASRPVGARGCVHNPVDGHDVPVPHFGVVLTMAQWEELAARLKAAGTRFGIEPHIRFKGEVGEQATMFFQDPSGNALEFKAFADDGLLFAI